MQLSLDDYLDWARKRLGLTSDRELARRLGASHSAVTQYRTRRAYPSNDVMVNLARLAGQDPAEALLQLHMWKSESDDTRQVIAGMLEKIRNVAAAFAVGASLTGLFTALDPSIVQAGTKLEQTAPPSTVSVYYGKLWHWFQRTAEAVVGNFIPRFNVAA